MPEQRVEYQLIDNKGTRWPMGSDLLRTSDAVRKSWDAVCPDCAPHRIERRTVTVSEWEALPERRFPTSEGDTTAFGGGFPPITLTCTTGDCDNAATRFVEVEDAGEHPYCDACARCLVAVVSKRYRLVCVADLPDAGSYDDPDEATANNPSPANYEVYDSVERRYVGPTTAEEYDECLQRWSLKERVEVAIRALAPFITVGEDDEMAGAAVVRALDEYAAAGCAAERERDRAVLAARGEVA